MKKAGNEMLQFIAGILMLVAGLFILSQKVVVSNSFFYGELTLGGIHFSSGLIMIPLIAGIIWMFASGGSFASKLMTGFGVFVIVLSIILSTNIHLVRMKLFDWIVILVLIFGGVGLLIKVLFVGQNKEKKEKSSLEDRIEDELERLRKDN